MKSKLSKNLINIAKEFNKHDGSLYVVGGYVRNFLLGYAQSDIDICGNLKQDKVQEISKKLGFDCKVVNKKLGTLLIIADDEQFEYTTFRSENYPKSGAHNPSDVVFVNEITVDAKRRDFTVNAIYYDVLNDKLMDFYNGVKDVNKRLIKCIETPEFVFSADGLRLLRMVRFASELGFKIHGSTLKTAKQNGFMLKDVSPERITKEIKDILVAETKYGINKTCGINLINKLNFFKYIFHLNYDFKIKTRHISYKQFKKSNSEIRFVVFLILVLLNYFSFKSVNYNNLVFTINRLFGNSGIRCGEDLNSLTKIYLVIQSYLMGEKNIFLFANYHNLNVVEREVVNVFCDKGFLSQGVLNCKLKNIPLNEKMLNITNADLLESVQKQNISSIKKVLLQMCMNGELENTTEKLLKVAKTLDHDIINNKNK